MTESVKGQLRFLSTGFFLVCMEIIVLLRRQSPPESLISSHCAHNAISEQFRTGIY